MTSEQRNVPDELGKKVDTERTTRRTFLERALALGSGNAISGA